MSGIEGELNQTIGERGIARNSPSSEVRLEILVFLRRDEMASRSSDSEEEPEESDSEPDIDSARPRKCDESHDTDTTSSLKSSYHRQEFRIEFLKQAETRGSEDGPGRCTDANRIESGLFALGHHRKPRRHRPHKKRNPVP